MNKSLIALALVAGCGASDQSADNGSVAGGAGAEPRQLTSQAVQDVDGALTGLYEGGAAGQPNQLCIVEKGVSAQFGIVVWGAHLRSCSGAGEAIRRGKRLTLKMAGDETCAVEGSIEGGRVTLDAAVPSGCSYYCGASARFEGAVFTQKGATAADAAKAKDLAGDPLCEAVR